VTPTRAALVITLALALGLVSADGGGHPSMRVRMPAPATAAYARGAREADDAACVKCHAAIASEHEGSLHAKAFTDASFQRGYAAEPAAFCRSCHAPEQAPASEPDAFARSHGVSCVTCHRPDASGAVLAAAARPGADKSASRSPHAVTRVDDLGTRACVSCHDFAFPGAAALGEKGRMQKTALEHAASEARDRSCASCHMPRSERGRASHRFTASRDATLLSAALDVRASRDDDGRALFVLASRGVGHAFPTGDLFRRLVLRVKTPRGVIEHPFGRTFRASRDASGAIVRFESSDARLSPSQRVALPIPGAPGDLAWEIAYQRVTGVAQSPPGGTDVEDEIILARGTL
jgi:hypothetical protein